MLPISAQQNAGNSATSHAKLSGDALMCGTGLAVQTTYGKHLFGGQSSAARSLAFVLAVLRDHVSHIFLMRTKKQVVDGDAGGNVTAMANVKSIGNRAAFKFPGQSVRLDFWTVLSARANFAVSAGTSCPKPELASPFIFGAHTSPQSHGHGHGARFSLTLNGTESPGPSIATLPHKCDAALLAGVGYVGMGYLAGDRAESRSARNARRLDVKGFIARFTDDGDFGTLAGSHRSISFDRLVCGQARRDASTSRSGRRYFSTSEQK